MTRMTFTSAVALAVVLSATLLAACGSSTTGDQSGSTASGTASGGGSTGGSASSASGSYQLAATRPVGGTLTSNPAGIDCGTSCAATFPAGTSVTITATADSGFTFANWTDDCSGTGGCTLMMNAARSIGASFSTTNTANLCKGLVTDKATHQASPMSKPPLDQAVTDPDFGTTIRRITNAPAGGKIVPLYSTVEAWNADESYLLLYHTGDVSGRHELYNGKTYKFIKVLNIDPADIEQVYWDTTDPDILYYVDNYFPNQSNPVLVRFHVSSGQKDIIHTFTGCSAVSGGSDPMFTSWNSDVFGLRCDSGSSRSIFSYRVSTDTESAKVPTSSYNAPQPGPDGSLFFFDDNGKGKVLNPDMVLQRTLDLNSADEHATVGKIQSGDDMYYGVAFDSGPGGSGYGTLVAFDLTDGSSRVIIGPSTGYPYPPGGTHLSAMAYKKPGWVYVSTIGEVQPSKQGPLDNEIILADTNPGQTVVCRLAHDRTTGQDYFSEPHVTASPSGTRAIFASDWGNSSGPIDTYVIELPSYTP